MSMEVNNREVLDRVSAVLADVLEKDGRSLVPGMDLDTPLAELKLDSLKLVEVIYELEMCYSIETDEELLAQLATVGDLVAMIEAALREATA